MRGKDLVRQFRTGTWKSKPEAEKFARGAGAPDPSELLRCLEVLTKGRRAGELAMHQMRCAVFAVWGKRVIDKSLFLPYVRALKQGDATLRRVLVSLLPGVSRVEQHGELCELLRQGDQSLRQAAADVLKQVGGQSVMELMLQMVQEPQFSGHLEVIDVAVVIGGFRLVPILQHVVLAEQPKVQIAALRVLGDREKIVRNRVGASKAILPILKQNNEQLLEQAIRSLSAMATEDLYFEHVGSWLESPNLRLQAAAVEGLQWFRSARVIMALTKKLQQSSDRISKAALVAIQELGDDAILPALIEGLSHKNITVRSRAQQALTYLSENNRIDISRAILWLLRSKDPQIRRRAVELARSVRDPEGKFWPQLLGFLRDEDWWVREQVTEALIEIAGTQLTRFFVGYLQSPSELTRRWAVEVLARLKDPQALGLLVRTAQHDDDWWVREKAIEAMGELGDQRAVPYLLDLMQKEVGLQWSCIRAFEALEAREAAPHIVALLPGGPAEIQLAVLQCLEAFNDYQYAGEVMPLLESPDTEVSRAAFLLLNRWEAQAAYASQSSESGMGSPLDRLLLMSRQVQAEDLILAPHRKAFCKRDGKAFALSEHIFSPEQLRSILLAPLNSNQIAQLDELHDIDFSYEVTIQKLRFRAHMFYQHGGLSAVFRYVESTMASFERLGLPEKVTSFGQLNHGLVIFGGPTGSGKSTSLAAIIDYINRTSNRHIVCLEDPIEVVHSSKKSLVTQREIGAHSVSFERALRATLRQDPDVILVGEMRDLATISLAITAAETGHLVFGTLHTVSAETTLDRIINAFPASQQQQIRSMLAQSLRAVVCQYLLKRKDQPGRCLASEVMINNDAISNLIRKARQFQISSVISTSRDQGMQLMDHDLMRLYDAGMVYAQEVYMKAKNKQEFESLLEEGEVEQRHLSAPKLDVIVGTALDR